MKEQVLKSVIDLLENGESCALVTLTSSTGSSPAKEGLMMCVSLSGLICGTVGGGALEHKLLEQAQKAIEANNNVDFKYELNSAGELNMICGGSVTGFINIFNPQKKLVVFGAGHVGQKIAQVCKALDFKVYIVDDREEFRNANEFSEISEYYQCEPQNFDLDFKLDANTFVVITTRGHEMDYQAVKRVIDHDCYYVGMIGSKAKVAKTKQRLIQEGYEQNRIDSIYAPIGLDIADGTPAEIAIAIIAQILKVKNNR